jgi:hypothetical protein
VPTISHFFHLAELFGQIGPRCVQHDVYNASISTSSLSLRNLPAHHQPLRRRPGRTMQNKNNFLPMAIKLPGHPASTSSVVSSAHHRSRSLTLGIRKSRRNLGTPLILVIHPLIMMPGFGTARDRPNQSSRFKSISSLAVCPLNYRSTTSGARLSK